MFFEKHDAMPKECFYPKLKSVNEPQIYLIEDVILLQFCFQHRTAFSLTATFLNDKTVKHHILQK